MAILQGQSRNSPFILGTINSVSIKETPVFGVPSYPITATAIVDGDLTGHTWQWVRTSGPPIYMTTSENLATGSGISYFYLTITINDKQDRTFDFVLDPGKPYEQRVSVLFKGVLTDFVYGYSPTSQISTDLYAYPVECSTIQGQVDNIVVPPAFTGSPGYQGEGYSYWTFTLSWSEPTSDRSSYITNYQVLRNGSNIQNTPPTGPLEYVSEQHYPGQVLRDNPVGYWRFEETTGTTIKDYSGNNFDGTVVGSVTLGHPSLLPNHPSDYSAAFYVGGDAVHVPFNPALQLLGDMTVEAWINLFPSGSGLRFIVCHGTGGETPDTNFIYNFRIDSSGHLNAFHESGSGSNQFVDTGIVLNTNQVYYLVLVRDATTKEYIFYVDGEEVYRGTYGANPTDGSSGFLYIGGGPYSSVNFEGYLDEVAIYDYKLTPEQIKRHYEAGVVDVLTKYSILTEYNINSVYRSALSCEKDFASLSSNVVTPVVHGFADNINVGSQNTEISGVYYTYTGLSNFDTLMLSLQGSTSSTYYNIITTGIQQDSINTSVISSISGTYYQIIGP